MHGTRFAIEKPIHHRPVHVLFSGGLGEDMDENKIESMAVPGYEGRYTIDRDGNVYSLLRGKNTKMMTATLCSDGYCRVKMYDASGGKKMVAVHRMMAMTFLPLDVGRLFVNHKNCCKTDNRLVNIEWCTREENMRHAVRSGRLAARSPDPERVALAKEMRAGGYSYKEIIGRLQCGYATVHAYLNRDRG